VERRGLLQDIVIGGAVVAAAGLPYGLARLLAPEQGPPDQPVLRPPGALKDEAAFTAACIGCGLCGEVCPPRCIQFHKADGGGAVNTPYIVPEEKACTLCNKCMEVCPTEALAEVPRDEIDMGIADIDETACYPWVDRGICGACVAICPLGDKAMGFEFANIYRPIVKSGCVGCGLCVEVCPHPSRPIKIVARFDEAGRTRRG
jgi:ferredoxin-type protein NapG